MAEHSCLDCGRKIKHSGRCLRCNYKRKYGFEIDSEEAKEFARTRTDRANCIECGRKIEAKMKYCRNCFKKSKEAETSKRVSSKTKTELSKEIIDILKERIKEENSEEKLIEVAKGAITMCEKCGRDIVNAGRRRQTICMACAYLAKNGKPLAAAKNWPKSVPRKKLIDIGARILAKERLESSNK